MLSATDDELCRRLQSVHPQVPRDYIAQVVSQNGCDPARCLKDLERVSAQQAYNPIFSNTYPNFSTSGGATPPRNLPIRPAPPVPRPAAAVVGQRASEGADSGRFTLSPGSAGDRAASPSRVRHIFGFLRQRQRSNSDARKASLPAGALVEAMSNHLLPVPVSPDRPSSQPPSCPEAGPSSGTLLRSSRSTPDGFHELDSRPPRPPPPHFGSGPNRIVSLPLQVDIGMAVDNGECDDADMVLDFDPSPSRRDDRAHTTVSFGPNASVHQSPTLNRLDAQTFRKMQLSGALGAFRMQMDELRRDVARLNGIVCNNSDRSAASPKLEELQRAMAATAARLRPLREQLGAADPSGWPCAACTFVNHSELSRCEMCDMVRIEPSAGHCSGSFACYCCEPPPPPPPPTSAESPTPDLRVETENGWELVDPGV